MTVAIKMGDLTNKTQHAIQSLTAHPEQTYLAAGVHTVAWMSQVDWIMILTGIAISIRILIDLPVLYKVVHAWWRK